MITLQSLTGFAPIDRTISEVVSAYEVAFPNRIQAYYLIGSYADGTAVALSDIDFGVIFRQQFYNEQEEAAARTVAQTCAAASLTRLDIGVRAENSLDELHPVLQVAFKLGSELIYGTDIREQIQLPPIALYTQEVSAGARYFMARLHDQPELTGDQLDYPDPQDEFFGYTRKRIEAWYPAEMQAGTKELIATVSRIATATVAQLSAQYVPNKRAAIDLYQAYVGEPWGSFVATMFNRCKLQWQYALPTMPAERRELQALCRQMLDFENDFLARHKEMVLRSSTAVAHGKASWRRSSPP